MFDVETKLGEIHFSSIVINRIVENAIKGMDGKVVLHNYKGKYKEMMPGIASKMNFYNEKAGSVEFKENDDGYEIKIYVIIKFGASIKKITTDIIDSIYENGEKILGKKPNKVTVVVTGILSKNVAKRRIEVSR